MQAEAVFMSHVRLGDSEALLAMMLAKCSM